VRARGTHIVDCRHVVVATERGIEMHARRDQRAARVDAQLAPIAGELEALPSQRLEVGALHAVIARLAVAPLSVAIVRLAIRAAGRRATLEAGSPMR
jgi:hypothetical protein